MLRWRLLASAVILIPLFMVFWLDHQFATGWKAIPLQLHGGCPGLFVVPLAAVVAAAAAWELQSLFNAHGLHPHPGPTSCGPPLVVLAAGVEVVWPNVTSGHTTSVLLAVITAIFVIIMLMEMRRFERPGRALFHASLAIFAVLYLGLLMAFLVRMRFIGDPRTGLLAVISLLSIVKMSDVGAYTVGRIWGRHKLAPHISPGKTMEGAVGGIAAGCGAAWFCLNWLPHLLFGLPPMPGGHWWFIYGPLITVMGMLGDLSESMLKRDLQEKDSSHLVPGFGGILDILDSVLFAAPAGYFWWRWVVSGNPL